MNPDGQLKKVAMVQFERLLPGPIERVWAFQRNAARYGVDLANLAR
jgi:hypothetical protein